MNRMLTPQILHNTTLAGLKVQAVVVAFTRLVPAESGGRADVAGYTPASTWFSSTRWTIRG